jgi:cell division protein FtsL
MRYYDKGIKNAPIRRRPKLTGARRTLAILLTGGLLAVGFIYAIYQHTETVAYGYKTQQLLRECQQIEREKHQLELQRAYYRSPQVLEQAAERLGLVRPDSSQVIVAGRNGELKRWVPRSASTPAPSDPAESTTLPEPMNKLTSVTRTRPRRIEAADTSEVKGGQWSAVRGQWSESDPNLGAEPNQRKRASNLQGK